MIAESSRVAALFGFLGLVAGALGGTWVDNTLQRDRDIERYLFQLRLEGIQSFLKGQAGIGGMDPKDNTHIHPRERTNYGRYLIAISAPPEWVGAVRAWMVNERKRQHKEGSGVVPVDVCQPSDAESFEFYYQMRQALFEGSKEYHFFDKYALFKRQRDPDEEQKQKQLVGEVAVRCLPAHIR